MIWTSYNHGCGVVYRRKDGKMVLLTGVQGDFAYLQNGKKNRLKCLQEFNNKYIQCRKHNIKVVLFAVGINKNTK